MARLNEPAGTESLDSLKRRFVRQNRELARSNSTQSIKIRNLETHISQLVANNVSLRATVVQLQSELDGSRTRTLTENVDSVKRSLEEKLQEIGSLVAELNRPITKPSARPKSPARSPNQKLWKTTSGIGDGLEARQGWLPTIAEGKQFPRRTLDPSELNDLITNGSSDSPDIGPPPQISVDTDNTSTLQAESTRDQSVIADEDGSTSSLTSANLETRRRRRESNIGRESSLINATDISPSKESAAIRQPDLWAAQPIRAGAKRKLDIANRPSGDEAALKTMTKSGPKADEANNAEGQKSPARRVLAPKSVNTDPAASPKKSPVKEKPEARPGQRNNTKENHQRAQVHRASNSKTRNIDSVTDIINSVELPLPETVKLEPITPAPLDLLSPLSTEPSEPRPEGRGDTPPPANLTSRGGMRNESGAAGRGSRRARASVNYAEPNLISKMRRPTKDLVAAVWNDQIRSMSASVEPPDMTKDASGQTATLKTVVIRNELESNDGKRPAPVEDNRPEPQSPLGQKDETSNAPPAFDRSATRDRRRSTLHQAPSSNSTGDQQTGSSAVISTLVAGPRKTSTAVEGARMTSLEDAVQKLDIFDVAPSPPRPFGQLKARDRPEDARPNSAASIQSNSSISDRKIRAPANSLSSSTLSRSRSRRQTLGSEKGDTKSALPASSSSAGGSGGSKEIQARPAKSIVVVSDKASSETKSTAERIAERTAARRRSMML